MKPYKKTWTDEQLIDAVKNSKTKGQVLIKLKLRMAGGNYASIGRHIKQLHLNTDHFNAYTTGLKNLNFRKTHPITVVFSESGEASRQTVKKYLLKLKLILYQCAICGIGPMWDGKPLTLQLDHKNGIFNDNRIDNLRWLCPNCHSQTDTYCGKKVRTKLPKIDKRTLPRIHKHKFNHDLAIKEYAILKNSCAVAKRFGVSETAIRKIIKKNFQGQDSNLH